MARGRKQEKEEAPISLAMQRHFRQLGFWGWSQYFDWCRENGLEASLDKTPKQRERELEIPEQKRQAILARARSLQNPDRFLEAACRGDLAPEDVNRVEWKDVAAEIARSRKDTRDSLLTFLKMVNRESDLVFSFTHLKRLSAPYIVGLIKLHARERQWIRPAESWKAPSHNTHRQFASLCRHLLSNYDLPAFMTNTWLRKDKGAYRYRDWYVHMGAGKNIRTARTPYPLTRAMAHQFSQTPADYSIEGALMLADIRSLGGGPRIAEVLMATRLGMRVESDETKRKFWLSFYRFLIDNPMLDLRHAGPIVDFLVFQKFESQEVMTGPGVSEIRPPPQPNLSMSRRTPETLLRQVEAWHGELRKVKGADTRFWRGSGFAGLTLKTGPKEHPEEQVTWTVRELMSGQELVDEGRAMRHCVATYVDSCVRGDHSIWSVARQEAEAERRRALTVSLDARGVVTEARGPRNTMPNAQEWRVLEAWMQKAGLKAGPYLHRDF